MCTVKVPEVSVKEMLSLTSPKEFHEFLLHGREIADIPRYTATETDEKIITSQRGRNVSVKFKTHIGGDSAPLMPRAPLWLNHLPENRDLAKAITSAAQLYAYIAIDFGIVKTVFRELNDLCKKPEQMRYFWPALLTLLSMDNDLQDWRTMLSAPVVPRNVPTLPLRVRELCRAAATTLATASLLPPLELNASTTKQVEVLFNVDSGAVDIGTGGKPLWTYAINP